jgi:hypothetical protein
MVLDTFLEQHHIQPSSSFLRFLGVHLSGLGRKVWLTTSFKIQVSPRDLALAVFFLRSSAQGEPCRKRRFFLDHTMQWLHVLFGEEGIRMSDKGGERREGGRVYIDVSGGRVVRM